MQQLIIAISRVVLFKLIITIILKFLIVLLSATHSIKSFKNQSYGWEEGVLWEDYFDFSILLKNHFASYNFNKLPLPIKC